MNSGSETFLIGGGQTNAPANTRSRDSRRPPTTSSSSLLKAPNTSLRCTTASSLQSGYEGRSRHRQLIYRDQRRTPGRQSHRGEGHGRRHGRPDRRRPGLRGGRLEGETIVGHCARTALAGPAGTTSSAALPVPSAGFALAKGVTVNAKTGAITFTFVATDPGTLDWNLVFSNADVGFADSFRPPALAEAAKRTKCKAGYVRHNEGACTPRWRSRRGVARCPPAP